MAVNPADRGKTVPSVAAHLGGDDDWTRWATAAWRSLADPAGEYERWSERLRETTDHKEQAGAVVALFEITAYALGWRRPDQGLHAWVRLGRPQDHPVLALINDWRGDDIELITAWAGSPSCGAFMNFDYRIATACGFAESSKANPLPRSARHETLRWFQAHCTGGSDPFHAADHASAPVNFIHDAANPPSLIIDQSAEVPRATLLLSSYAGWYAHLFHLGRTLPPHQRSWRVDVLVKPFGWMGQYRRSRNTGMWFTGQHRWHMLAYPTTGDEPISFT